MNQDQEVSLSTFQDAAQHYEGIQSRAFINAMRDLRGILSGYPVPYQRIVDSAGTGSKPAVTQSTAAPLFVLIDLCCGPGPLTIRTASVLTADYMAVVDTWDEAVETLVEQLKTFNPSEAIEQYIGTVESYIEGDAFHNTLCRARDYLESEYPESTIENPPKVIVTMANASGYFSPEQLVKIFDQIASRPEVSAVVVNLFVETDQQIVYPASNLLQKIDVNSDTDTYDYTWDLGFEFKMTSLSDHQAQAVQMAIQNHGFKVNTSVYVDFKAERLLTAYRS